MSAHLTAPTEFVEANGIRFQYPELFVEHTEMFLQGR
jgi:hypothetical protein